MKQLLFARAACVADPVTIHLLRKTMHACAELHGQPYYLLRVAGKMQDVNCAGGGRKTSMHPEQPACIRPVGGCFLAQHILHVRCALPYTAHTCSPLSAPVPAAATACCWTGGSICTCLQPRSGHRKPLCSHHSQQTNSFSLMPDIS